MDIADEYMTSQQAAKELFLTKRQINFLCQNGKLIGAKMFGNIWIIPKKTVKAYQILKNKKKGNRY